MISFIVGVVTTICCVLAAFTLLFWVLSVTDRNSPEDISWPLFWIFLTFFVPAVTGISLGVWHSHYDYAGTVEEFKSQEINGYDVIIDGDEMVNLNEEFSRKFTVGTPIYKVNFDKDHGWFESEGFEYRLTPTGE